MEVHLQDKISNFHSYYQKIQQELPFAEVQVQTEAQKLLVQKHTELENASQEFEKNVEDLTSNIKTWKEKKQSSDKRITEEDFHAEKQKAEKKERQFRTAKKILFWGGIILAGLGFAAGMAAPLLFPLVGLVITLALSIGLVGSGVLAFKCSSDFSFPKEKISLYTDADFKDFIKKYIENEQGENTFYLSPKYLDNEDLQNFYSKYKQAVCKLPQP